jgi:PAS domain S-box-containing protein
MREGQPLIWACVQDITEEKRARELERESQAMLERRVEERTRELTHANERLAQEVADRRTAEQKLAEASRRLQSVLASNPVLVYSCSIDSETFATTFMSENSEIESGYPTRWFIDDPDFWIDHIHPDDREHALRSMDELVRQGSGSFEYRFLHGNGTYQLIRDTARVVRNEDGEPVELVGCWNNVTEQRKAEEQLRLVQSAVTDISEAVMITDARVYSGGPYIVYVNPAFERMTGYTAGDVVGRPSRLLRGYGCDAETTKKLKDALHHGKPYSGRVLNYHKNRTEYTVEWRASPIRDDSGTITHWVVIQEDITRRLQDQDMLRRREEELEHVTRLSTMGEMASGLAHELNQPLAAIQNYARGALRRIGAEGVCGEQIADALDRISVQAERSGQIIRRLRQLVAKREPSRSTIDINGLIRDVLMLFESDLRSHTMRVETRLADDLPVIYGDHVQIEQVLLNLLRNAVAATQDNAPDGRMIDIVSSPDGAWGVTIGVYDRGCGMAPEELGQIFDPFYTTKPDGIGMGLTISQTIVEAHGGRLVAIPREGGGMCFEAVLPCDSLRAVAETGGSTC